MLLNLKKLRQDNISDKLIDYRKNKINHFMDQDAFNVVFCNKVKFAPLRYNLLNFYFEVLPIETLENFYDEKLNPKIIENYKNASILHLGGPEKPWNMWMGYLSLTYLKYSFSYSYILFFNIFISLIKKLSVKRQFDKILSFVYISKKENLNPKNVYNIFKARGLIKYYNLFDETYYLINYPDVKNSNLNPLDHYIYHGWKEKRNPSPNFDGNYYLRKYSDVRKSNTNPLVHYVLHGKEEGRFPNPNADSSFSETKKIEKHPLLKIDNKIIIFDENQNEEIVSKIKGLTVTFRGKNNVVKIEKGSIFYSSHIILQNNCQVNIKKTNRYGIRSLSADLADNCSIKIGKDFSSVSIRFSQSQEKNLNVIIGDYCMCADGVIIRPTDGHAIYDIETNELLNKGEDVFIGDHVWLGLNCLILKGSYLSNNTVIGAHSLVNKKFKEENVVVAGSPAKIIKRNVNWDRKNPVVYENAKKDGRYPNPDTGSSFSETKKIEKHPLLLKPSDKPRVSIIIPIFNVEMYLEECLDSVVNQNLRDIEIICVNDGSTDNSLSILEEYAEKDERIKIISKPNSGYGHTMNLGIEAATGEYIGIVEPDDHVKLDMYETLYIEAVKNDVDLIKADFYRFTGSGENLEKTYNKVAKKDENYNRIINPRNELEIFNFVMNTWSGIYKKDFIEKYNIRHNETPGASFQDNGFWFQTLALATRTYFLNKPFYMNRRDNPGSSVHDKGKVFAMCKEYDFIRNFLDKNPILDKNPEFKEKLIYVYQQKRYHNYIYTLNRIGSEFHKIFLEKFHEDYVLATENNELDGELFSKRDWDLLQLIIKDPTSVIESDFKKVSRKSFSDEDSANGLIYKKRKFNRLLSFLYTLKKEKLNPKNIYKIYKARRQIKSLNLFDEVYYLINYLDVRKSNMNLLDHYIYIGWMEKRTPSKKFDGNYYLRKYSDVRKSKTNPLVHYVLHGKEEGRFPNHHAEMNSPQYINKKFQDIIKNLEKSLSQSNTYLQNIKTEVEENNQLHRKEIEKFEKKLNLTKSVLYNIIEGSSKKKLCPTCGTETIAFLPFGENSRPNAQCPNCGSLERHRATYMFLKENTGVFKENIRLLHVAPEKILYDIFRAHKNIDYLTVDLNDKSDHVMEKMDIQDIQYSDNTFDFIYCSHVLEHVPNDRKAIDELYRVLKPDGKALILVPMNRSLDETLEDPGYNTPELRLKHYLQSDHLRLYGSDFTHRLEDAGFKILTDNIKFREDMDEEDLKRYGIDKCIQFFYCAKPD
ncbi:hypothetical protein MB9_1687 [Methanobacterium formicicum]|uniref:Glycosyltransferase 2-like domain-containing protein n=1 Tax=Methanobacterium formicicum TaxID=2162 RepID=A0A0S4FQN4_METFO|nr:hypothetical protein MB9_1687 [Methanobacterium formicicum]